MEFLTRFLNFDKMITTMIIKVLYWIFLGLTVIFGLYTMFTGGFFRGLAVILIGPFIVRIYAELMIVLFSIHENLVKIRLKQEENA